MATAKVIAAYTENGVACLEVTVAGVGTDYVYTGRCPVDATYGLRQSDGAYVQWETLSDADQVAAGGTGTTWANLTAAQRKNALAAAVKVVRDGQAKVAPPDISGTITI